MPCTPQAENTSLLLLTNGTGPQLYCGHSWLLTHPPTTTIRLSPRIRLASHVFLDGKVGDWTDASATDNLFHQYFRGCRAGLLPWRQIRRQKSSYEIADDVGVTRPRIYKSASVKLPCCLPEMILRSDPGGLSRLRLVVGSAEQPGPHSYPPTHRD